jgi:hypothetical protein
MWPFLTGKEERVPFTERHEVLGVKAIEPTLVATDRALEHDSAWDWTS